MNENYQLHHEKLEVYQSAIRFLIKSIAISKGIPRGYGEINDQLKRASLSIPLNISEGYAKSSSKEKKRFLDIARGSAHAYLYPQFLHNAGPASTALLQVF